MLELIYLNHGLISFSSTLTAKQLAVQFGCLRLEQPTLKLLKEYKSRVVNQLHESRKKSFNIDNPVYLISAFYIQGQRMKVNIEREKLLSIASVSEKQFLRIKQSMMEVCFPEVLKKDKERKERLKKLNIGRNGKKKTPMVTISMRENITPVSNDNYSPIDPCEST